MEELAKLEAERGTPEYTSMDGIAVNVGAETIGRHHRESTANNSGVSDRKKGKQERVASNEMCTFLILNISSLQLIPVNMIAYRSQYGSVNPAGIIAPAIVATFISTLTAVVSCIAKAKRYSAAVGVFFDYIRRNTDIANVELYDAISFNRLRENSYMKRMMTYIEKCELLAGVAEQEPLTLMQAEKLLTWSNEQLEGAGWEEVTGFKKAMAAVGIKMMMLYGITYRELRKIKWEHYDDQYGFIAIKGFALRLPSRLSRQFKEPLTTRALFSPIFYVYTA